MIRKTLFFF
jgi:branched-chain amino acid aminotransferase